jgi:hypothetical protein
MAIKELEELKKEKELIEDQVQLLYEKEHAIDAEIAIARFEELTSSGILNSKTWFYGDFRVVSEWVSLRADCHYWEELVHLIGEQGYHWRFDIVENEIEMIEDDGNFWLCIRHEAAGKWMNKLKLQVDIRSIDRFIEEIDEEIAGKEANKALAMKIRERVVYSHLKTYPFEEQVKHP